MKTIIASGLLVFSALASAKPILLEGNLDAWSSVSTQGETTYEQVVDMEQGVVLRAHSQASSSGYQYSKKINLNKTPILQWQWTAQQLPFFMAMSEGGIESKQNNYDEKSKQGDDFALRLVVGLDPLFGDKKSIHYVWAQNEKIGSHWDLDAFTKVMVVSGENQTTMQWQTLARHIQQDWFELFSEHIEHIDFISFITDTDSIKGESIAYYGDMRTLAGKAIPKDHEMKDGKLVAKE